jgi:hypothetical protein
MDLGIFLPITNNGWIMSKNARPKWVYGQTMSSITIAMGICNGFSTIYLVNIRT